MESKRGSVSEDITYTKASVGMQLGSKGQKVLGLAWDYEADDLTFNLTMIAKHARGLLATKCNTPQLLEGIFDPLEIVDPATVSAKIMFEESSRQKSGWDKPLQGKLKQTVGQWIKGFTECEKITIVTSHAKTFLRNECTASKWMRNG